MRRFPGPAAAAVVACVLGAAPLVARSVGWVDDDGVVHYEDPPKDGRGRAPTQPPRAAEVELYATRWCPTCEKARAWFRDHGVDFVEYDVEADPAARDRKVRLAVRKIVPVVVIDGRVIEGYRPKEYAAALGR